MKKQIIIIFLILISYTSFAQPFITPFEKSNGKQTATYFEAIDFYKSLAKSFSTIKILTGDTTDVGYPLHVVLFSADKNFDINAWHKKHKVVVLINNGIHPGKADGLQ